MCLIIDQLEPKIADKDIVCYKMVTKSRIKGVYISEYRRFKYITEKLYTNNIKIELSYKLIKYKVLFGHFIEEGMFHSYVSHLYPEILRPLPNHTLLKCIIPKGAYYFKGYFDDCPSYASSQIKILEEI